MSMKKQSFNPTARNMKGILTIALAGALLTACSPKPEKHYDIDSVASEKGTEVFQPDWTNIAQHYKFPQWFQDGKFGIFIHWGVYSVPAFGNKTVRNISTTSKLTENIPTSDTKTLSRSLRATNSMPTNGPHCLKKPEPDTSYP